MKEIASRSDRRKNRCIRFSDREWEAISNMAEQAGLSRGAYLRKTGLRGTKIKKPRRKNPNVATEIRRLSDELSRVGNNLNQLARWANARLKARESKHFGLQELVQRIDEALGEFEQVKAKVQKTVDDC